MHRSLLARAALIAWAVLPAEPARSQSTLIRRAAVIDGTGAPARLADVRLRGSLIAEIGDLRPQPGERVFDARGLTLAPGFIDSHSHHDRGLLAARDALAAVSQGITTIVVGQDGGSPFPLGSFFARLDSQPAAVNVAAFVGHGTLRRRALGDDYARVATAAEAERMRNLLREELAPGALGLSTGLEYDPGIFATTGEVLELARVTAAHGGRYISHIRSEDREFWRALAEVLTIGREARLPVQISHMKLAMRGLWGQGDSLVRVLERARASGIDVTADVYPYTMWQSTLTVLYPKRNFSDRAETEFILKEIAAPDDLVLGEFELNADYVGKTVGQIAALRGTDPATTLMALIAESQARQADESVVARGMDERDVATLYRWPFTSVSSDGAPNGSHPRGFGAFPRVLGKYVREDRVFSLPEAVRRMTSLPAASLGIPGRGTIAPGGAADLVLFDPQTVADRATLAHPHEPAIGIAAVWVNGELVFDKDRTTGRYPGRVIRRVQAPDFSSRLDSLVRAEMARQRIPGVAVAVVHKGNVTARGYGFANVEHDVPATEETIFQSGSLGKMFTALAVMLQVEDGRLALSDPLTKFFPAAPAAWREITVRHLLTHTSGIPDYTTDAFDYRRDYTEDELARLAFAQPLEFPPGSRWNYSNTGYALLGFIIGKVAGRFYGDELGERVFKPLGMRTARIITEADIVPHRAAGYRLEDGGGALKNQEWVAPQLNTTADGSLYFSIRDLVTWEAAVRRRALLRPASWDLMLSPVALNSGRTYPYGFGWSLESRGGAPLYQHGGSWQGFKSQLSRFTGEDLTVIVLANLAEANPARVADGIAAVINPALAVPTPQAIADREPRVTERILRVLSLAREGRLTPAEFAYVRAGFFPGAANRYRELLQRVGAPSRPVLVERRELGDDRVYLYEVTLGERVYYVRLGLAPDDRISAFSLFPKPSGP